MHLAYRVLDVTRIMVDVHLHALQQAEECPCLLKDVAQRKEADRSILVGQHRQSLEVNVERGIEAVVSEHRTLGLAGSSRSVKQSCKVASCGRRPA